MTFSRDPKHLAAHGFELAKADAHRARKALARMPADASKWDRHPVERNWKRALWQMQACAVKFHTGADPMKDEDWGGFRYM